MLEFAAGLAVGAATMFAIAVTLGARWRRKRRKADEAHAAMLLAVWDVQDAATLNWYFPTNDPTVLENRLKEMRALKLERNTAARRYFAAVGE